MNPAPLPSPRNDSATYALVLCGVGLAAFCAVFLALTGDIGFQGDDWWVFSRGYWNPFPESIAVYFRDSQRPIEGMYWMSLFKVLGFNRDAFHFSSLMLCLVDALLVGACLAGVYPGRNRLIVLAVTAAFTLPAVLPLTYMIHTDNSRLAAALAWTAILLFQRWASGPLLRRGLILPVSVYLLSCFTYECGVFLVFAAPFFAWNPYARGSRPIDTRGFLVRVCGAVITGFILFLLARFLLLSGGAVGHGRLMNVPGLAVDYVSAFVRYLTIPFSDPARDAASWGAAAAVIALVAFIFIRCPDRSQPSDTHLTTRPELYGSFLGLLVFCLGITPYLLAGYHADMGFHSQSRVFSSAGAGFAILFASIVSRDGPWALRLQIPAMAIVVVWTAFSVGLRSDWLQAAAIRTNLCESLLKAAPSVKPHTVFLFRDLHTYLRDRAVIFQGVDGVRDYVRMLYHDPTLDAYFLYPLSALDSAEPKAATVTPAGIVPRGRYSEPPIPPDRLVIFDRQGDTLALTDRIRAGDDTTAVVWEGVEEIATNRSLIVDAVKTAPAPGLCGTR